jgi:hypothetical protein
MDAKSKRGCLWAVLGAGVLVLIVGAALFGGAAWLVYQSSSVKSSTATPDRAAEALDAVRARFAGQDPLITIDDDEHARVVRRKRASGAALTSLHVLAFDPREHQLKRITLPFWVLRLSPGNGELKIGDDTLRLRGERVTIRDVEDAGPGLLVDHADRLGRLVLVWTE